MLAGSTIPPDAVVLGSAGLLVVATMAPAPALVAVPTAVLVPESACSEAPSSVPQLLVYHFMTCWLSLVLVQTESQMPVGEL